MNQDALELMAKAIDLMQTVVEQNTQLIQINHEQSAQINALLDQLTDEYKKGPSINSLDDI